MNPRTEIIFLTGATGFIGSHVLPLLLEKGHHIRALRRKSTQLTTHPNLTWVSGDLASINSDSLRGCSVMIHLAAVGVNPQDGGWDQCMHWNVLVPTKLMLRAIDCGIRSFIWAGSCFEYGRSGEIFERLPVSAPLLPIGPYAASKAAASLAAIAVASEKRVSLNILRPFQVYGPGEAANRLWPSIEASARAGLSLRMTDGLQIRDFIHVGDVAKVFVGSIVQPSHPGIPIIQNVGTGNGQTLREFASQWWLHWGGTGSLLFGALPDRENEVTRYVADTNTCLQNSKFRK